MTKSKVKKLSNSFSTGGGGINFEQNIQALFLLSLLTDGICPILDEPMKSIRFQAKALGADVDDFVVFTDRKRGEGKLLCQVKHQITVSERNDSFKEVIAAAWSVFNKKSFDKKNDRIVLAVAQIAENTLKSMRFINEHALVSYDETEFLERIEKGNFSSNNDRRILGIIRECIKKENNDIVPNNQELWMFCRVFVAALFDLDYLRSINRTLATALIKKSSRKNPQLVWSKLVDYAGRYNQRSATVSLANIDSELINLFQKVDESIEPPKPLIEIDMFIPILTLIGSWDENNENDRTIIEGISSLTYRDFESKARAMLIQNPDYLFLDNGRWVVRNRKLLFKQCTGLVFDDVITRLFENARKVFEQCNRAFESDYPHSISSSSICNNSNELRNGLVDGMCMLRYAAGELCNCNTDLLRRHCREFIRTILHNCDRSRWIGLKKHLQGFAELEPHTFLSELEDNIIHNSHVVLEL